MSGPIEQQDESADQGNLFGLYQQKRPGTTDLIPRKTTLRPFSFGLLAYDQPTMFFAAEYNDLTSHILAMAIEVYNSSTNNGLPEDEAAQNALFFLQQAGVDQGVATELLQNIEFGVLVTDEQVVQLLNRIADS